MYLERLSITLKKDKKTRIIKVFVMLDRHNSISLLKFKRFMYTNVLILQNVSLLNRIHSSIDVNCNIWLLKTCFIRSLIQTAMSLLNR